MPKQAKNDLLQFTTKGIWCPQAAIYIDPWRPVKKALITHGHADHARRGHASYLCTESAAPVIKYRLGDINIQTVSFGQTVNINGVEFSFHPAGHILGSAQIRVAYKGEIWVASGDYKLDIDPLAEAFESVKCHTFITESTFGLPKFKWKPQTEIFTEINNWWRANAALGKVSFITAYSLGKAQRVIQGLDTSIGKIYTHGSVENVNEIIRAQGVPLNATTRVSRRVGNHEYIGGLIIGPPGTLNSPWIKKFKPIAIAVASGWMALGDTRRHESAERGFALSDHADWRELNRAVKATGAERVIVTHGYKEEYTSYLQAQGLDAEAAQTEFAGED